MLIYFSALIFFRFVKYLHNLIILKIIYHFFISYFAYTSNLYHKTISKTTLISFKIIKILIYFYYLLLINYFQLLIVIVFLFE